MWQSPDPILDEYMSGQTNGGVFNPKNLGLFTYSYNDPVNLVDPDGNNPGPVYLKGPLEQIDLKSGNAAIDNTVLGAVNTLFNFSNSVVNSGLNALASYGDAIAPHEAAIESISSGLGPQAKAGGMAIVASAKAAKFVGTLGKAGKVIEETLSAKNKNITSQQTLNSDEALDAGLQFLGDGYKEIGKQGSGVFRSSDNSRQFRIDKNSLEGNHQPNVPHIHLETVDPDTGKFKVNNHIPLKD